MLKNNLSSPAKHTCFSSKVCFYEAEYAVADISGNGDFSTSEKWEL